MKCDKSELVGCPYKRDDCIRDEEEELLEEIFDRLVKDIINKISKNNTSNNDEKVNKSGEK